MKVLQVNCVYKKGSTGKIVADIHSELQKKGIESIVCYGRGTKIKEPNVYKTCPEWYSKFNNLLSRFTGLMYGGCFFSTLYLIHIIKREKPDVVHLHCINGYFVNIYRLINWLKTNKIKTVLTLHAEFMHTANCGHALECERWKTGCGKCPRLKSEMKSLFFDRTHESWLKMKDAFDEFQDLSVVSVSPWLKSRAEQSPILSKQKHFVVLNGVDSNIFRPKDKSSLKQKYGFYGKKVIFHVTSFFTDKLDSFKGGYFVLQLAQMLPEFEFVVAGSHDAIKDIPKNLHILGSISNQKVLADYYSLSDVTLIVSKREAFSMPVAESISCGTPVVGFMAGGPESICDSGNGYFVEYGNIEKLFAVIKKIISENKTNIFDSRYSKQSMIDAYSEIYKRMLI